MRGRAVLLLCIAALLAGCSSGSSPGPSRALPAIGYAIESSVDVWAEAARRQPNGPSYEFFEPLLPPMRYVDAYWRHYPIVLSAPRAPVKARFISNGSGINLLARQPNWIGESGVPVRVSVGRDLHPYGSDITRLDGPRYLNGYLPIVQTRYTHREQTFTQEVFAPVDPELARLGDEPDRALVSFYGKLAHGMTRDTYIGGEGASITPIDEHRRQLYLPPNSAANANYLQPLRYLLVQDYDLDDDGRAETLRLAFATPRAWLRDGGRIEVTNAPTKFGVASYTIRSFLASGRVEADVTLPARQTPENVLLRLRLPDGRRAVSASVDGKKARVQQSDNGETIDLSGLKGTVKVVARTSP